MINSQQRIIRTVLVCSALTLATTLCGLTQWRALKPAAAAAVPNAKTTRMPPTLGIYPNTAVTAGGNIVVMPSGGTYAGIISITAAAVGSMQSPFSGTFAVSQDNGYVTITNAKPKGTYTVTVTAIDSSGSATASFTLTVNNPNVCSPPNNGFGSAPGSPINVSDEPNFIAVGDFNGDGRQDLAVVNRAGPNVSILLGDGNGSFTQAAGSPISVGGLPQTAVVGDFNGDGRQDLATANVTSDNVTILRGNGDGTFVQFAGSPVAVGEEPYSIALGDFNGDGRQDLATANFASNTATILLGNGSGGFSQAAASPIAVDQLPTSVVVGDFNNDGKDDLAVGNGFTA